MSFRPPAPPRLVAPLASLALVLALASCARKDSSPAATTPAPAPAPVPSPLGVVPDSGAAGAGQPSLLPPSVGRVNVMGRDLLLPPPPGMTVVPLENTATPGGAVLARFVPDSTFARWQRLPGARSTHVLAIATAITEMNRSETSASETIEHLRQTPPGPIADPAIEERWNQALRAGLAGRRAALPPHPGRAARVARLDAPPGVFAEILLESSGGRQGVAATAIVLVRQRAVLLYVGVQEPRETTDLASLEHVLIDWVMALQNANRV